ncbi:MAG: molecular chaperone TorD family protein [Eggerthellaceae bacterium]|nr:molecular chaperone TorD family protein [Eggerthellaceae bacterium]
MTQDTQFNSEEERTLALSDASLAALLAKGFLRPVAAFIEEMRSGSYVAQLRSVLDASSDARIAEALDSIEAMGTQLAEQDAEEARLTLEVDYNRLFVGPGVLLATPYESFYRSETDENGRGTICGLPMLAVKDFYTRFGTKMPEQFIEFPDHIALELEFLSLLAQEEAKCWEADDADGARVFQEGAAEFRRDHLGVWVQRFAVDVAAGAETKLYPALAELVLCTQI